MDSRELVPYFPFVDGEFMFATQPNRYISHLIGQEGPGSTMSYIKSKGWANGLSAGAYPACLGTPGIFDVQVRWTEEGFKNYPKIVKIYSHYINLLRESPSQEWIFHEQKGMPEVEIKFNGHSRLREFAPDEIEKALATIRPDNFRMVIMLRNYPGNWDQKENKLEVEKKEVAGPALNPRVLRNDSIARTWWKKDDTFRVTRANVIVSMKTPLIYASAENNVKARLFSDLVRDALEEYSYDAELAGLQYNVCLDSRGLFLDIVRERLIRGYSNWQLQSSYHQVGDYTDWLNVRERDFLVEELAAELPNVTLEVVRLFRKQMLGQVFIEVHVHGNLYKEDALKATNMVESILKPRGLPKAQWPILRSLVLTNGFNYVFRKTLKDPINVNHCVETWFYVGSREDRDIRTKTLLLDQMLHEPAFDQLRTKKQLGYIAFSSPRAFSTTYGFRFLIRSEMTPEFLDSPHRDAAQIKLLTRPEVIEFFHQRLNPASSHRVRFPIHLQAQGKVEGVDKRQEEAQKKADEEPSPGDAVKTAEEITDVRLYKAGLAASSGARPVKDINEYGCTDVKL
ncbi:related to insulysin precursor (metalloendopeptidase) [Fusarium mangiferae]|uniref:Related to insulysin (Metalloendopeptidase) n=1 Tax=Fusarium mangiferae TaxID=192010 RepID=A0A1L7UK24_FUSMA|nr:uncharacterized protein FMAN_14209 [Fusarium mangiferae]CVL08127.1 related to insulysin precursor (metalloendopeptidase) [Fusarium mangiferae]